MGKQQARVSDPAIDLGGITATDRDEWVARLVWRLAAELDCDPFSLPPLGRELDLEAVAALATDGHSTLSFCCAGCEVFVGAGGQVTVERLDDK